MSTYGDTTQSQTPAGPVGRPPLRRATNGRIGSKWRIGAGFRKPVPTLLLDHVGRKSGKTFTTPLLYLEDGANLVIVASQGGLPKNPQWYPNLVAHPEVTVHVRRLREKIEDDPTEPALIHTVWGVGYRLDAPVAAP